MFISDHLLVYKRHALHFCFSFKRKQMIITKRTHMYKQKSNNVMKAISCYNAKWNETGEQDYCIQILEESI